MASPCRSGATTCPGILDVPLSKSSVPCSSSPSAETSLGAIYENTAFAGGWRQASSTIAQSPVSLEDIAVVTSFLTCTRSGGTALAIAIGDTVFLNTSQRGIIKLLPDRVPSDVQELILGLGNSFFDNLELNIHEEILDIIMSSFKKLFLSFGGQPKCAETTWNHTCFTSLPFLKGRRNLYIARCSIQWRQS